eukprot:6081268-Amphidinium_carterae.1
MTSSHDMGHCSACVTNTLTKHTSLAAESCTPLPPGLLRTPRVAPAVAGRTGLAAKEDRNARRGTAPPLSTYSVPIRAPAFPQ